MAEFNRDAIVGAWVHSFEEDTSEESVYRPKGFSFSRARGRREFHLQSNGKVFDNSTGKGDLPEPVSGDWDVENAQVSIHYLDGSEEQFSIKDVSPEKLVIMKT